jgi:hypothetical protein
MYTGYIVFVKRDMYQFVYYKHVTNKKIYRHICHIIDIYIYIYIYPFMYVSPWNPICQLQRFRLNILEIGSLAHTFSSK